MDDERARLQSALEELTGDCVTTEDLAGKLIEAGCKGARGDCFTCPVAQWIIRYLGLGSRDVVAVMHKEIEVRREGDSEATGVRTPILVQAFIGRFDDNVTGVWPELVTSPA